MSTCCLISERTQKRAEEEEEAVKVGNGKQRRNAQPRDKRMNESRLLG